MQYILLFVLAILAWCVVAVISAYRTDKAKWLVKAHGERAPPSFLSWLTHSWGKAIRLPYQKAGQRGAMNIGGIMMLGISMVFLAIGFIFLPISTNATTTLLAYEYSANTGIKDSTYTGFTAVLGITPLLILVGFLTAAVVTGMMGVKIMKGASGFKADPGSLMLLGLSIIFIAIGLIIEPVMLDGVSSVLHNNGTGISSSFTGYSSIILVTPMLVHLAFLSAAVLSGFFGIKKLASASTG